MRIVLQHGRTFLYLENPGTWTRQLTEAFDFGTSQRALEFARRHALTEVQPVAVFISGSYVEKIPLQGGSSPRPLQALGPAA